MQRVTVETAENATPMHEHTFGTIVESGDEAVLSAQIGGRVARIAVQEGDTVRKGQTLMRISAPEYGQKVQHAQTLVNIAREKEKRARRHWNEYKPEERAQFKLDVQQADALRAEAAAAAAKTHIRAPFDGVVSTRFVTEGTTVANGTPLIRVIGHNAQKDIALDVVEDIARAVSVGDTIALSHDDMHGTATVYAIDPIASDATRKMTIHAHIDAGADFAVGTFVDAHVRVARDQHGVAVPRGALVRFYDDVVVFVLRDNHVHPVVVDVIAEDDDQLIVSGIEHGARVVVSGAHLLHDGDVVEVISEK